MVRLQKLGLMALICAATMAMPTSFASASPKSGSTIAAGHHKKAHKGKHQKHHKHGKHKHAA